MDQIRPPNLSGLMPDFSGLSMGGGSSSGGSSRPTKVESPQDEDGLLAGLFKIFIAALKIPTKFDLITQGFTNAGLSLATGIEGIAKSAYLGLEDIIFGIIVLYTIVSKYMGCFLSFLMNLPGCFVAHIISCVFSVLYLIFPLTSWIFYTGTGISLMPFYNAGFDTLDSFDDMIYPYTGFYFTKFPPSITKQCYTCNGKVIRLRDILKDVSKFSEVGDKFSHDMTKTVPRYMKPAMPYIHKTADAIDQVFFQ